MNMKLLPQITPRKRKASKAVLLSGSDRAATPSEPDETDRAPAQVFFAIVSSRNHLAAQAGEDCKVRLLCIVPACRAWWGDG